MFLSASVYCGNDTDPQLDRLYDDLSHKDQTIFVTGLSVYLKLQGEQFLKENLNTLLTLSTKGHVVVLTYQCKKYLSFHDPRLQARIFVVDGAEGSHPSLVFTSDDYKNQKNTTALNGIKSLSSIEELDADTISIYTQKKRSSYPRSLVLIADRNNAYDVLCDIDSSTAHLDSSLGNEQQWAYALSQFDNKSSWADVINAHYGNHKALHLVLHNYSLYSSEEKWLFFIALKLFGCTDNWCVNTAVKTALGSDDFVRQIYRSILSISPDDKDFALHYAQRKHILNQLQNPLEETIDFCKIVISKGDKAIYYLTDSTQKEKELVFSLLDKYGESYGKETVIEILQLVYPDLAVYLSPYNFRNDLLNSYFDQYRYQKVVNRVFPDFEKIVTEQAEKREYNLILQPRSSILEGIDINGAQLFFVDAMGVEYLSFILAQCKKLNLLAKITVCSCELPSITSKNKEFLDHFQGSDHPIVSIKELDEIKHHGKENYDYQQTKLPIHLVRELDIIRDLLERIKEKLVSGTIGNAVIIADHGASRLAVIHETETVWEMPEKGLHSGRCCLKSEIDEKPAFATDAGDYWALANYDRFKGSRKASVEVHGGATLEEVSVPIIELTYNPGKIEVHILPPTNVNVDFDAVPEIEVSFRKKASVRLYISANVSDVSIRIDGRSYDAKATEPNNFLVEMPDIKRPKTYYVDVCAGDNLIAEHLPIKVKSEGMGSNSKGIL